MHTYINSNAVAILILQAKQYQEWEKSSGDCIWIWYVLGAFPFSSGVELILG